MAKKPSVYIVGANALITAMYKDHDYPLVPTLNMADIVQFVGGADVNPQKYGETMMYNTHIDLNSDIRDDHAFDKSDGKFRVGICRGGQFLNIRSGGRMWQHVTGHQAGGQGHLIKDLLFEDSPNQIQVSSTHHQMMIPGSKGEVLAFAFGLAKGHQTQNARNVITPFDTEVVWYGSTQSLCFQPHPEHQQFRPCTKYFFKLLEHFYG